MQLQEEAVFTLKMNGKPVIDELGDLEKALNELKTAQKEVERGTKEWAENKAQIKALEESIKAVREEVGVSGMTVRQLQGYYNQLNKEIRDLTPGTEAYIEKSNQLKEVDGKLQEHRQNIKHVSDEVDKQPGLWQRVKDAAAGYLVAFTLTGAFERFVQFIGDGIKKALELSDMMGGVAKATGLSAEKVEDLSRKIDAIDTRTTKQALMDIAQIGGQLGVANKDLLGFIESVDRAVVALGDEFTGGAEEVAKSLGGLQKLFKETADLDAGSAINKIGSALNELGAAGSATAPVVADFTARMGQLGNLSPQITQTMGLGAAFQELGLSAEIAAGGLTNILLGAAKATDLFAQQLGMTEVEFKKLINTDPNGFLLKLAESFRGIPADQLAKRLDDLGIKSQEATKVMSLLKDQTDMVRQKQELANTAYTKGTSLVDEFNKMNSTAAAEYAKSQKAIDQLATEIGMNLLPFVTKTTQAVIAFVDIIRAAPAFIEENKTTISALGVAILAFNTNLIASTAASLAHAAAEKARLIWTESGTAAQWLLNAALSANPIGVVVGSIALLVAGLTAIYNNSIEVRAAVNGLWEVMKTASAVAVEFVQAFLNMDVQSMVDVMSNGGTRVANAFNKGYNDQFNEERPRQLAAHNAHLDDKKASAGKAASDIAKKDSDEDAGAIATKTQQNEVHRKQELERAKQKADQEREAREKANQDALNKMTEMHIEAIANELDREIARLQFKHDKEVDAVNASKASEKLKTEYIHELNQKLTQDIAKAQDDARRKQLEEDKKATDAIDQMRIEAMDKDEKREIARLQFKRDKEAENIAGSKASQEIKAEWEKALNDQLTRDIAKVQEDARAKRDAEEKKQREEREARDRETASTIGEAEFNLNRISLEKQLENEKATASEKKQIKLDLIKLERDEELRKIEDLYQAKLKQLREEKAEALRKAQEQGQGIEDIEKSFRQAEIAANTEKRANEAAAEQEFANKKRDIEKASLAERQENLKGFFDMAKALLKGDFDEFTDILNQKLLGEGKQLSESKKAQVANIEAVQEVAHVAFDAWKEMNDEKLSNTLAGLKKEYDTTLAMLKAKHANGLISKDDYESQVAALNAQYAEKQKQEQLKAWKREQNMRIGMAIVDAAAAALKSLAMLGWPLGLIGVAASAVMAGIQIAAIKRQQPPSFASGGKIRNAGVPDGPGHGRAYGQSGLAIVARDGNGGYSHEVGEMEGGEPIMILSRKTYANNRKVVDKLLHSSLHRNGAPIYQSGGMFSDGGTYGDYVGKMFVDGGEWGAEDYASDTPDLGQGTTGGSGATDTYSEPDYSAAEYDNSIREEQIKESQATMNAIKINTEHMDGVLMDILTLMREPLFDLLNNNAGGIQAAIIDHGKMMDQQLNAANGSLVLISQKELSVDVQTINNINNEIKVIIDESMLKP